jgi:hypothetical protein
VEKVLKAKATRLGKLEGTLYPDEDAPFDRMNYYGLQHTPSTSELSDLYSREQMEKWLYALNMKVALPTPRPSHNDMELVYSPLNLSIFFRVLSTVHKNGYPAHWLADILSTILNNRVSTTARPPRTYPLRISETKKALPTAHIDLEPFMPEFRTLAALWLAELPFGLITSAPIPPPTKITRYSITFSETSWNGDTKLPVFTLLLADIINIGSIPRDIRRFLLSDEQGSQDAKARQFRKQCAVITTLEWDMKGKTATFWLDRDSAEKFKETGWYGMILRTDNWSVCSRPEDLRRMKTGESCVERRVYHIVCGSNSASRNTVRVEISVFEAHLAAP